MTKIKSEAQAKDHDYPPNNKLSPENESITFNENLIIDH